jgi:hypothetical protein
MRERSAAVNTGSRRNRPNLKRSISQKLPKIPAKNSVMRLEIKRSERRGRIWGNRRAVRFQLPAVRNTTMGLNHFVH